MRSRTYIEIGIRLSDVQLVKEEATKLFGVVLSGVKEVIIHTSSITLFNERCHLDDLWSCSHYKERLQANHSILFIPTYHIRVVDNLFN